MTSSYSSQVEKLHSERLNNRQIAKVFSIAQPSRFYVNDRDG